MILTTERLRAFRFNLSLFDEASDKAAADKLAADAKAQADKDAAALEELKNANHAKSVIERVNAEAKASRERAEKAEADAAAAKKALEEREAKDLADQKKFEELYNKEKADRATESAKNAEELSKRDAAALLREVRDAAKAAGILDPDFIELPVFAEAMKLAKVDGGKVIGADDVVEKMRSIKASAFKPVETAEEKAKREADEKKAKDEADRVAQLERDRNGRFTNRPAPTTTTTGDVDYSKLNDAEFEQREAELRAQTARL